MAHQNYHQRYSNSVKYREKNVEDWELYSGNKHHPYMPKIRNKFSHCEVANDSV